MASIDFDDEFTAPARCPRCGYDQHGAVMQWTNACPLAGTCSECGLRFMWGRVLRPDKYEPGWCVEFVRRVAEWPRRVISTAVMSFAPWVFWKRLRMSDRIHWGGLIGYGCVLLIPLLVCFAAEQTAVALRVRQLIEQEHAATVAYNQQHLAMLQRLQAGQTRPMLKQHFNKEISVLQAFLQSQPVDNLTPEEGVLEAVFKPISIRSKGTMSAGPWGATGYPAPLDLHARALGVDRANENVSIVLFGTPFGWLYLPAGLIAFLGIPVGLFFLPISRSLARVRWVHLVRITLYCVIVPVVVLSVFLILLAAQFGIGDANATLTRSIGIVGRWPLIVLINLWWIIAIRRYLHMPRGWLIAPLFTLLSVLLVAGVTYLLNPDLLIDV